MREGHQTPPAAYLTPGGTWPDSPLTPDAPPVAEYARLFVQNLTHATGLAGRPNREAAAKLGFSRTALTRVLTGEGFPSLTMIVGLEQQLDIDLYPGGPELRAELAS